MNKGLKAAIYATMIGVAGYFGYTIYQFMKESDKTAEDFLEFKYKHFARFLTNEGMAFDPKKSLALVKLLKDNYGGK